jgi:hypothetical protein
MPIKFPDWVAPPTPCNNRTYSVVSVDVHHGVIIEHVSVSVHDTWADAVIIGCGDWICS